MTVPSLVLLSGGLDSTAALILEARHGPETVAAVFFHYGQPMAARELAAARRACSALGVRLHERDLSAVFEAFGGGLMASPAAGRDGDGRDTAFLPGRNAVLLSVAASVAAQFWPHGSTLVVGFNRGDVAGFPDCGREFCFHLEVSLREGGSRSSIRAPWAHHDKREIVDWVRREAPERIDLLAGSWSCYRADGPCGECTACITRAAAGVPSDPEPPGS